jgi:hypothetical protein
LSKEESGMAATFKSTSGWEDGKYYCLHNAAPAGTVIKISTKSSQRTVYAKVLDVIPDLKKNDGLSFSSAMQQQRNWVFPVKT